jgi:O-antigen/teichoic acid export membrane protein
LFDVYVSISTLFSRLKGLQGRFARDTGIYFGANLASTAVPFVLLPVLTRVLSPADYGLVAMFGVLVSIVTPLTGLSAYGAVGVRFFQLEAAQFASYVGACLWIVAVSTCAVAVVVAVSGLYLEQLTQVPYVWLLAAVALSGAQAIINVQLSLWQSQQHPVPYGVLQFGQSVVNVALSLVLVLAAGLAWQGRTLGQLITAVVFLVIAALLLRRRVVLWPVDRAHVADAVRFGMPLIPHFLGALAIAAADRVIVAKMLGLDEAGMYMVAVQLGMGISLLTEAFNKAYAPWLMSTLARKGTSSESRIVRGTYAYFAAVTVMALTLGLLAPWILSFLAGPTFQGAAAAVVYIAMGFAFGGMYYMVAGYVFFASRTSALALTTVIAGLINVVATIVLIRVNGMIGAAQGFMLSQAVLFLGTWWLANRAHPMPWMGALFQARPRPGSLENKAES